MDTGQKVKKRRQDFARKLKIPPSASCRADLVRRLTKEIRVVALKHIGSDPQNWRDQQARKALEAKINMRAVVLALLRTQNPTLHDALCRAIEEG